MASPVIRQSVKTNNSGKTVTFGSNLTANSYIVFGIATGGGAAFQGYTSSAGNVYTPLDNSSAAGGFVLYSGPNIKGAVAETITITTTASGVYAVACEITGTYALAPVDSNTVLQNPATPVTYANMVAKSQNTLLIILSGFTGVGIITMTGAYAGFTVQQASNSVLIFGTEAAIGTYNPTMTWANGSTFLTWGVVLASQAPPAPPAQNTTWNCVNLNQSMRGLRK